VLKGWGKDETRIGPEDIDWNDEYSANPLPFRLRQEPGPLNPLGRIKFMFPNRFSVYLHDTPAKYLFDTDVRQFSHGCIRVERPVDLAEYLLMSSDDWPREKIVQAIESEERQEIPLPEFINVLVLYLTSWVDEDGQVQFRPDVYGRDARLLNTMQEGPPKP
jgi:murein L,D-transpeptidase YcbB/YkuD